MDLPKPPEDQELRNIIDKLAQFVARNGLEFEQMTKNKQKDNAKFAFLFGGEYFNYYQYKVTTEQAILKQKQKVMEQQALVQHTITQQSIQSAPWQHHVQQQQIQDQIQQSERNLAAQNQMLIQQQQVQIDEAVRKAQDEKLQALAKEVDIDLQLCDKIMQPIIDSCTKDSISAGKGWIFSHATSPKHCEVITRYLLKRVTTLGTSFELKLHLVYLINDVLHHCVRKNADDLKKALETMVVPVFCTTSLGASEDQQQKLSKLLKLWESNNYFEASVLEQLKNPSASLAAYQTNLITSHASVITPITTAIQNQYAVLQKQHQEFVSHITGQLQHPDQPFSGISSQTPVPMAVQHPSAVSVTENSITSSLSVSANSLTPNSIESSVEMTSPTSIGGQAASSVSSGPPPFVQPPPSFPPNFSHPPPNFTHPPPGFIPNFNQPPPNFQQPPPGMPPPFAPAEILEDRDSGMLGTRSLPDSWFSRNCGLQEEVTQTGLPLPDLSKPPPCFPVRLPPPHQPPVLDLNDPNLMPSVPYYELPAGLMAPLVKLEEAEYRPLDPDEIRLPPPAPPSERLLAAVELFYTPPSHERPRNSEGWEQLGLYEFFKAKSQAKKRKEEEFKELKSSSSPRRRSRSRSQSRERTLRSKSKSPPLMKKRRYNEQRSKSRSKSRSRSRSKSASPLPYKRSSRSRSRSISPPKPTRSRSASRSRSRSNSPPPSHSRKRSVSRSPTPPSFFGGAYASTNMDRRLDESNKGHQLLRKMGWGGQGLGAAEQGIHDPISAGDVRDRQDQYKGIGINLNDPFETFRKSKGQAFINRMRARAEEKMNH